MLTRRDELGCLPLEVPGFRTAPQPSFQIPLAVAATELPVRAGGGLVVRSDLRKHGARSS